MFEWPTYVLQRRVNVQPDVVALIVENSAVFGSDCVIAGHSDDGALYLDTPFRVAECGRTTVRLATGRLTDRHGRRVAHVEIEIRPWCARSTELQLRPTATHP